MPIIVVPTPECFSGVFYFLRNLPVRSWFHSCSYDLKKSWLQMEVNGIMWKNWVRPVVVSGGLGLAMAGFMLGNPVWTDSSAVQAKEPKERHPHIRAAI